MSVRFDQLSRIRAHNDLNPSLYIEFHFLDLSPNTILLPTTKNSFLLLLSSLDINFNERCAVHINIILPDYHRVYRLLIDQRGPRWVQHVASAHRQRRLLDLSTLVWGANWWVLQLFIRWLQRHRPLVAQWLFGLNQELMQFQNWLLWVHWLEVLLAILGLIVSCRGWLLFSI